MGENYTINTNMNVIKITEAYFPIASETKDLTMLLAVSILHYEKVVVWLMAGLFNTPAFCGGPNCITL
jgi:hypothetical protein